MHKKIIAGVMSTLICAAALSPDAGVFATQYSTKKGAVTAENGKTNTTKEINLFDLAENKDAGETTVTENSETKTETIRAVTGEDAAEVTEDVTPLITAVPADEDIIETVELGEHITGYIYNNGLLRIHGYGDMNDFNGTPFRNAGSVTQILFENEDAINAKRITNIGQYALAGLTALTASSCDDITKAEAGVVQIPDSVISIGAGAFYECASIREIKLNYGLKEIHSSAFAACKGLTDFNVPASVTHMEENMLNSCTELKTLTLPYAATNKSIADGKESISSLSSVTDLFVGYGNNENAPSYLKDYSVSKITVTGGDKIPDYAFSGFATLKEVDLSKTKVNSIGNYAFFNCNSLENVALNENIESVGDYGFANTAIKALPDNKKIKTIGAHAFYGCKSLSDITIPESYQSIGGFAFRNCTGITELVIPENVISMDVGLFHECTNLKTLTLPYAATSKDIAELNSSITALTSVSDLFFEYGNAENNPGLYKDYSISKITITGGDKIPAYAFSGMSSLKEIDLSSTKALMIEDHAFYNCSALEKINIPDSVLSIGTRSFHNCSSLGELKLDKSLESIGQEAFRDCTGLHSFTIPDSVTSMAPGIFTGCTNIESLELPYAASHKSCTDADGTTNAYNSVFDLFIEYGNHENAPALMEGYSISKITINGGEKVSSFAFAGMSTLKEIDLSKSKITSVDEYAFYRCGNLEKVTLNDSLESIGRYAFAYTAVKSLPDNKKIKTLGNNVFEGCTKLTDITIPESYQSMGNYSFKECTGITELVIPESLTSMGYGSFYGCTNIKALTLPYAATSKEAAESYSSVNAYSSVYDLFIEYGNHENAPALLKDYSISKITITGGEKIPVYAFSGFSTLKEVDLSQTQIDTLGRCAFCNCGSLENIKLPDSLKTIEDGAFRDCTAIKNIDLNDGLESIGSYAFMNCTGIHSLTIPETVTSMGINMLRGAVNLEELVIPYAGTDKGCTDKEGTVSAYNSVVDLFNDYGNHENATNLLDDYAVSKIVVTGGEKIPDYAFSGFSKLTEIDLSNTKVESIGNYAFNNCTSAETIIIPETVEAVGNGAFANSNSDIYIYNPECSVSEKAFSDDYSGTIHGLTESSVKNLSDNKEYKFDALDDEIIIGPVNLSLTVGETYKINSNKKDLQYKSSDTEVVTVSKDGVISAEKEGKASVEVKADNENKSSMNIWVRTPVVVTEPVQTTAEPPVTTSEAAVTTTVTSATTEPETTSVSETDKPAVTTVTSTEPITTTVTGTEQTTVTTVTSTEPVTATVTGTEQTTVTTVTTAEPVTTAASETTTVTTTEPVTTSASASETTTVTTVTTTEPVTTSVSETTTVTTTEPVTTSASASETTTVTTVTTTEPVTTSVSETEQTTVTSEESVTTSASETEAEVTGSASENNGDGKLFNIGSLDEIANMALTDYSLRTGTEAAEAIVIPVTAENYKIEIKDENGNILDTYTINPKTGEGTTSENEPVNLPQTGNNSTRNLFTALAALLMTALGIIAVKFSGISFRRRKGSK